MIPVLVVLVVLVLVDLVQAQALDQVQAQLEVPQVVLQNQQNLPNWRFQPSVRIMMMRLSRIMNPHILL
jgi:hypothetical protein